MALLPRLARVWQSQSAAASVLGSSGVLEQLQQLRTLGSSTAHAAAAASPQQQQQQQHQQQQDSPKQKQQQQQGQQPYKTPVYAACVLERLPITKSPPPAWEAEHKAWVALQLGSEGRLKHYPSLDGKQQQQQQGAAAEGSSGAAAADKGGPTFNAATTAADASGATNTMKRQLAEKLVLLVRTKSANALACGSSSSASSSSSIAPGWTFPHTRYAPGETIRQAAERALREAVGQCHVHFVGNAPMAHLNILASSSDGAAAQQQQQQPPEAPSDASAQPQQQQQNQQQQKQPAVVGRVFFHLATVVNDPWDVALVPDGPASDHAWVSKAELPRFLDDARLLALAEQML